MSEASITVQSEESNAMQSKEGTTMHSKEGITMHSGGAQGSDLCWGEACKPYGIKVIHWRPQNIKKEDLEEGKSKILEANKTLKRRVDKYLDFLARNWVQVGGFYKTHVSKKAKYAEEVYAVGKLVVEGEKGRKGFKSSVSFPMVDGGTAYACMCAINEKKPVYLFDQDDNKWKRFEPDIRDWVTIQNPVIKVKYFAGIGTRDITHSGKKAIEEILARSFK